MPRIHFETKNLRLRKEVNVPDGGALVEICAEHLAPIPFSCRSASCGTCQLEVLEGGEYFEPPDTAEQELLDLIALADSDRLACQARLRPGAGIVRVRPRAEP